MNGSEKQIKWAEKILGDLLKSGENEKNRISEKLQKRIKKQSEIGNTEKAKALQDRLNEQIKDIDFALSWIPKINDAAKVIDLRLSAEDASSPNANWYRLAGDFALMAGKRI